MRDTGKEVVLIRYGELFLKSEPVKRQFISLLKRNLEIALDSKSLSHKFEVQRGRILVYGEDPLAIAAVASRIFGVVDVSVALRTDPDLEMISGAALAHAKKSLKPGISFAVRAKRQGVSGITSQEIAARVGAAVQKAVPGTEVDLASPDYEIFVEMRDFGGFVYDCRHQGPGGLPWGTQGRVLSLLSAGIDSPVASWLMMKRGCEVTHLHLNGGSFFGSDVADTVLRHLCTLSTWVAGFPLDLMMVDAEYFYELLCEKVKPRYRCVLCKRFMVGVGSVIAAKEGGIKAMLLGDSLGQVASQTLHNIAVTSENASFTVLRPLIGFDKEETVALARQIGTFDPVHGDIGCNAVPRLPATQADLGEIRRCEENMDMQALIDEAQNQVRHYTAKNGVLEDATRIDPRFRPQAA